ncbi:serine/threonine protein kinase [Chloroflexota bacterium]
MSDSPTPDMLIGRELDGYIIEEMLGQGGMARVYRGRDVRLNRHVAVKVIQPDVRSDPDYASRFEKEARAVAQLEHQHIVGIYRFGEVDGLYYMVMQYIEGADLLWVLNDYAADNELFPHEDVLRIITQIGEALDYAHSRGVIHRDVKPANIMLTPEGDAILADFGLALLQIEGTRGEIFGSPHYVAPEQAINSAGAVPQSDIYALGVVLYEMLTGRVPFDEGSALNIALAHMTEAPPSPLQINPDLHAAFLPVLDTALQKEPTERYQSGAEMTTALQEALALVAGTSSQKQNPASRLSTLVVPDKVDEFRQKNPLPPLPPQSEPPTVPAPLANKPESDAPATVLAQTHEQAPAENNPPVNNHRKWIIGAAASAAVLLLCLVFVIVMGAINQQPEATPTPALVADEITATSIPEITSTATMTITVTASPSFTPVVLPEVAVVPSLVVVEATATSIPTITSTATMTATVEIIMPTATPTVAPEIEVEPSQTPLITATPLPVVLTPAPVAVAVDLRFAANGDKSLYIMNESAEPFPLSSLTFRIIKGLVQGPEWETAALLPQECVRVQKDERSEGPDVDCNPVGTIVMREKDERFWSHKEDTFAVYYGSAYVGVCDTAGCTLSITTQDTAIPLQFATNRDRSLYIINAGADPLPLAPLELRGEEIIATEEWWQGSELNQQECIRLQKDERADPPDITCTPVGEIITIGGRERFWKSEFAVYYDNQSIGTCATGGCSLTINLTN